MHGRQDLRQQHVPLIWQHARRRAGMTARRLLRSSSTTMPYRDDQEALRARLEATEQRLRVAEEELAEAKRRLEEPLAPEPSAPPLSASSRCVGYPPSARHFQYDTLAAAVSGTVLSFLGIAFLLPADEGLADVVKTLFIAIAIALGPLAWFLYSALRRCPDEQRGLDAEPRSIRIAPRARIEVYPGEDAEDDTAEDDGRAASPPRSMRTEEAEAQDASKIGRIFPFPSR
jgi:hypothetical protein